MGKKKYKILISPLSIYLPYFSLYKTNKDGSTLYRCKFCYKSRIKSENDLLYRLSGHSRKCLVINKTDKLTGIPNFNIENDQSQWNEDKRKYHNKRNICKRRLTKNKSDKEEKMLSISKKNLIKENEDYIIYENFIVNKNKIIGEGSFVKTYLGYDSKQNEEVAIKFCKENAKITCVFIEIITLTLISEEEGFPRLKGAFKYNKNEVIIETLLGPSLDKIIHFYNKPFTVPTICLIGIEIIKRLESLHKLGILHNDLKPSNFSWGIFKEGEIKNKNEIFLIDFGLASRYKFLCENRDEEKYKNSKKIYDNKSPNSTRVSGNLKFMSFDLLLGNNSSPKTEMESFIYILIFLFHYKLPWYNIKAKNHLDKKNKMIEIHKNINGKELCNGLPYQIYFIYNEITSLKDKEEPNYKLYAEVLNDLIYLNKSSKSNGFCWEDKIIEYKKENLKEKKNEYLLL